MTSTTSPAGHRTPSRPTPEAPERTTGTPATSSQRLPALSGIAFAALLMVGFVMSGGDTPDYAAADLDWTNWADHNETKGAIGALLTLLAGFVFLPFAATIRSRFATAEATVVGAAQLARVAFAAGLIGITGITMAVTMIAGASAEGADANPVVTRAVATASMGPFLVAAMGFSASLTAAGLLTLRSRVFARWTGIVALVGAAAFLTTIFTLPDGPTTDSVFGYAFFPGMLALTVWSGATSTQMLRA